MKEKIANEAMLAHPDFSKHFDVHADSSAYQLGGVVSQEGRPIAFFSKKLNSAQKNYPITEKELLSIVETLKEFKYLLLGNRITVHTDHRTLTYPDTKHTCDRVLRQRLLLEEYGCDIRYIEGAKNVAADALSRLEANLVEPIKNESHFTRYRYQENVSVPVDMKVIAKMQRADERLMGIRERCPNWFKVEKIDAETSLLLYRVKEDVNRFLMYVPASLANALLGWFHVNLFYPGATRLAETVRQLFYIKGLDEKAQELVRKCPECQSSKVTAVRLVGKVPLRLERSLKLFEVIRVDCCGPWPVEVEIRNNRSRRTVTKKVHAVTMIDDATGWPKIAQLDEKKRTISPNGLIHNGCAVIHAQQKWCVTTAANLWAANFKSYCTATQ